MEDKTIIVINDNTTAAEHAALLALKLAQKTGAGIVLANEVKVAAGQSVGVHQSAVKEEEIPFGEERQDSLPEFLNARNGLSGQDKIDVSEIDISLFGVEDLSRFIIKNRVWMIVKGANSFRDQTDGLHINIQYVLNKVMCPLLLMPVNCSIKDFEQIAYIADLRYCRMPVVRYLAEFAAAYHANLYIDHLSAKGLPHMDEKYALHFFNDEFKNKVDYEKLFFNNIRERDINKAVDVMINGMHIDILALVNHRFHFEEILGRTIPDNLPEQITIPLLIFPY